MQHKRWIALALAAAVSAAALSVTALAAESVETEPQTTAEETTERTHHAKHGHKKIAEPENALGKQAAKDLALADAGLSEEQAGTVKVRVIRMEDGTVAYRVSFTASDLWYRYKLDAVTGEILDKTSMDSAEHEAEKAARAEKTGKPERGTKDGAEAGSRGRRHGGSHSTQEEDGGE